KYDISILGRSRDKIKRIFEDKVEAITWDELDALALEAMIKFDLIINLAGANIGEKLWTKKRKQIILNSRINTTKKIAELCSQLGKKSPTLFNANAIGVYGLQKTTNMGLPEALDEDTPIDFTQSSDF